jgi:hypothetical protein
MVKIKEILCLFVPPVFIILKNKFKNRNKPLETKELVSTIGDIIPTREKLVVIGNGPSLNDSFKGQKDTIKENDCIVVNRFCETDYYVEIKPKFYLLADPAYFITIDNDTSGYKDIVNGFVDSIMNKTTWDINLIVPSFAKGCDLINVVEKNNYIHVFFYNSTNVYKTNSSQMKYEAWDNNLIAPPAQTCLNTCVWLGVFLRYKEIYLIGADTSFLEYLRVNQETNDIYIKSSHFYQDEEVSTSNYYEASKGEKMVGWTLHGLIYAYGKMFEDYYDLEKYARYKGVKIYNASEYSWINVFERKKLK